MEKELQTINVTLATPYLFTNLNDAIEDWGIEGVLKQSIRYGYDPENLSDTDIIITQGKRLVKLHGPDSGKNGFYLSNVALSDLVISGNTESAEKATRMLTGEKGGICKLGMNTGTIVARYSIFYGGPSQYTETLPKDAGYSLDLPKDPSIVKKMLNDDYFLESIIDRKEDAIVDSIDRINRELKNPILVTDYLQKALEVTISERRGIKEGIMKVYKELSEIEDLMSQLKVKK